MSWPGRAAVAGRRGVEQPRPPSPALLYPSMTVPYVLEIASFLSYRFSIMAQVLLRPREVARQLAVSRSTVYRWFWEGKIKGVKMIGGTVRILAESVQEKLDEVA